MPGQSHLCLAVRWTGSSQCLVLMDSLDAMYPLFPRSREFLGAPYESLLSFLTLLLQQQTNPSYATWAPLPKNGVEAPPCCQPRKGLPGTPDLNLCGPFPFLFNAEIDGKDSKFSRKDEGYIFHGSLKALAPCPDLSQELCVLENWLPSHLL